LNGTTVSSLWTVTSVPLNTTSFDNAAFMSAQPLAVPTFYQGTFEAEFIADTYLAMRGWGKGMAWINGFNLGRYWETQGPQHTLFVPAPVLAWGLNTITVWAWQARSVSDVPRCSSLSSRATI
jgi:beta-galactosidase